MQKGFEISIQDVDWEPKSSHCRCFRKMCSESSQVKYAVTMFEKHLQGISFLVKLQARFLIYMNFFISIIAEFWSQISEKLFSKTSLNRYFWDMFIFSFIFHLSERSIVSQSWESIFNNMESSEMRFNTKEIQVFVFDAGQLPLNSYS